MRNFLLATIVLTLLTSMSYALPFIATSDWVNNKKPVIFSGDLQKNIFTLSTIEITKPNDADLQDDSAIACNNVQCIAAGQHKDERGFITSPMILQSHNQGKSWVELSESNKDSDDEIYYTGQGCTDTMCMIVKLIRNYDKDTEKLSIAVRHNQDTAWIYPVIEGQFPDANPKHITIYDVSCQGTVCNIAGNYHDQADNIYPLLIHSSDNGFTWVYPAIKTQYKGNTASLFTVNCHGKNCLASGRLRDETSKQFPLLFVSDNDGITWTESSVSSIPLIQKAGKAAGKEHFIKNSRCSASFCVAVGAYEYGVLPPLLMVSYDKGASWTYPQSIFDKFPSLGGVQFFGLSVEGDVALASGFYERSGDFHRYPILARTTDAGHTWDYIFPNDYPKDAFLFHQLSYQNGYFFSVGAINGKAAIVRSEDGVTWSYAPLDVRGSLSAFLSSKKCPSCYLEKNKLQKYLFHKAY